MRLTAKRARRRRADGQNLESAMVFSKDKAAVLTAASAAGPSAAGPSSEDGVDYSLSVVVGVVVGVVVADRLASVADCYLPIGNGHNIIGRSATKFYTRGACVGKFNHRRACTCHNQ
jgi:hypothetical protein